MSLIKLARINYNGKIIFSSFFVNAAAIYLTDAYIGRTERTMIVDGDVEYGSEKKYENIKIFQSDVQKKYVSDPIGALLKSTVLSCGFGGASVLLTSGYVINSYYNKTNLLKHDK